MSSISLKNRPAWHALAGRIAKLFGIYFYDLYYGEKDLHPRSGLVVPSLTTEVRLASPEDLDNIVDRTGEDVRREFDHNTAINSTCYVAFHKDTIMGYIWVNRQIIDLVGMYVARLPARHSFTHNAFVFPEHRRKKVYQCLLNTVCIEMHKAGFLSTAYLVDKSHLWSIRALKHVSVELHNAAVLKLPGIKPIFFCRAF